MKKILITTLVFFTISCIDEKPAEYEEKLTVFSSITGGLSMGVGGDTCVVSLSNEITNEKNSFINLNILLVLGLVVLIIIYFRTRIDDIVRI